MSGESDPLLLPKIRKDTPVNNRETQYGSNATCNSSRESFTGDTENEIPKIPLSKLFRYATRSDKWIIGIGTVCTLIVAAQFPFLAIVIGRMADALFLADSHNRTNFIPPDGVGTNVYFDPKLYEPTPAGFAELIRGVTLLCFFTGLVIFVVAFVEGLCWEVASERQVYRLRQEYFYEVLRKEISWFDTHQSGDLAIKLTDDIERIREGLGHKFGMIIQFVSSFILCLAVGLVTSWKLTMVIVILLPLLIAAGAFTGKLISKESVDEQQHYGKAGGIAVEVLSSIRTVAAFGTERREVERYSEALNEGSKKAVRKYHLHAAVLALVFFVNHASYSVAFWYGCKLLNEGEITPGQIFTVTLTVLVGSFNLGQVFPFMSTLKVAQACGAIVMNIIDKKPTIDASSTEGIVPSKISGRIQFCNVTFSYPTRKNVIVLQDFNISIPEGSKVAIVGLSGAGKSTIVNLILRFYDPDEGLVLIDGNDLKALNLAWLRHNIGYVSQEPVLFSTTIYDNISYGRKDLRAEEVVQAAKLAFAHDFIMQLPQGYHTIVGERGCKLSGGQKQRIAIARALARNPSILLLDESTSALDSKSEAIVQAALDHASRGRTTVIIAHRLSTVRDADIIYALQDGKIVESGTHPELMGKQGFYHELVVAQTVSQSLIGDDDRDDGFSSQEDESGKESDDGDEYIENARKNYTLLLASKQLHNQRPKRVRRYRRKSNRRCSTTITSDPAYTFVGEDRLNADATELHVEKPSFMKILRSNGPEQCYLVLGTIGSIISGLVIPAFSYMFSEMFDIFIEKRGQNLMNIAFNTSMIFLGIAVASFIGVWMRTLFLAITGEHLTLRLRLTSFSNILRQSMSWFDKDQNSPSRLSTRLARDAPLVKAAAGHRVAVTLSSIIAIVATVAIAFAFGWQLALVMTAGFPFMCLSGYLQGRMQSAGHTRDAKRMTEASSCASEAFANIRTVQSMGQERAFCGRYFELLYPMYIESHRHGFIFSFANAFATCISFMFYALSCWLAIDLVGSGTMQGTDFFRVFIAMAFCAFSFGEAMSWVQDYNKAKLAAGLIFHLIEEKSTIDPLNQGGLTPVIQGLIDLEDIHFHYPSRPHVRVLKGLSLRLEPGKTLALIGPSGCGKSTIISLLQRFYDVDGGHVMIDGYDIRSLNLQHLRGHIGVVTQDPVIFNMSISENIGYGYPYSDDLPPKDLIIQAAISANIHNFIISLPQGYDTIVGERGTQLSGGERQRIAIARALIRNPAILLLDEPTSSLDAENERLVQEALDKARVGRTCIIVAHRLSTIRNADWIAVMGKGRIVEVGAHQELINAKGTYYKLTKNQLIF